MKLARPPRWQPWDGFQTSPRWFAPGNAGRLPTRLAWAAVALLATADGCSQSSGGSAGSGGLSGSGGTAGGATASGGASGAAGMDGSGGVASAGGASGGTAAGGTVGAGGVASSGGTAGSGGAVGAGGASIRAGGRSGAGGASIGGAPGSGGATSTSGAGGEGGRASGGATGSSTGGRGGGAGGGVGGGVSGAGGSAGIGGSAAGGTGGGSSQTVDCSDSSTTTFSFTKQYEGGSIAVTGSTKTYYTQTNWWHKFGGQTVGIDGLSMKLGNSAGTSVPASDGNPMGFPSIFIGAYSGHETVGSNLPKQVSAIQSVPTVFQTNASSLDTSNFNATYDVWFTASGGKLTSAMQNNPGKGGAYLMVWMFKPADRQPRGGVAGATSPNGAPDSPNIPAHTVDGVPGSWDVWLDTQSDPLCISYVSSTPMDGLGFDLNKFIQDSVTNKYGITSSMYLNLVFGGFEVWSGGDGLQLEQFCAAVN